MRRLLSLTSALVALKLAAANGNTASTIVSPDINTPQTRQTWGDFDINTNYYEVTPDTGRTVEVYTAFNYSDQ
jgi:hypothetical protein